MAREGRRLTEALQAFLRDHDVTQKQLAQLAERPESYVSERMRYVEGRLPTVDLLSAAADAAGMTLPALLRDLAARVSRE